MDKNISRIITDICKKEGIDYSSPYYKDILRNDTKRLGEIIFEIYSLADELECILSRHDVGNFTKERIEKDLLELDDIHHDLQNLAQKIIAEKK